jgi:hypothetical protein
MGEEIDRETMRDAPVPVPITPQNSGKYFPEYHYEDEESKPYA